MRILVIVLLLAPLALLEACSPRGAFVVAFSQIGADNPWRTAETESIREEAKRRGIELRFADGQGKQEKQVADLRAFLAMGVDAIVLAPQTKAGWQPVLEEVRAAKVPLVLVDRGVDVADPGSMRR
jgi:simple sugar transport system substrate-binding protein